jgi:tRNA modification GTPase
MDISRFEDTIAATATLPGTGAITVIRVSGTDALAVVDRVVTFRSGTAASAPAQTIKYGTIFRNGAAVDEVLVSVFRAPHSYTGEDSAEISCHASPYISSEILRLLCEAGVRPADPGEFTRRAFVNGKLDLAQAEAVADVILSKTESSLRVAQNQLRGGYSSHLKDLRERLVEMTSLLELELDFSEEDVEFADRPKLLGLIDATLSRIVRLTESFRYGNALRNGVPVAIVGAVNSGKSTLLNALLEDDRALVSDVAGTTRDTVEETLTLGGILFRFIDTAGLRETSDSVENMGIDRSYRKLGEASVVLAVLDLSRPEEENEAVITDIVSKVDFGHQMLMILLNKADLLGDNINVNDCYNYVTIAGNKSVMMHISAKTGFGIETLKDLLIESQKGLSAESDETIVTNLRHYEALRKAGKALEAARAALASGLPSDLVAEDLRQANYHLGSILGEVTDDEILGRIFERFCIGK